MKLDKFTVNSTATIIMLHTLLSTRRISDVAVCNTEPSTLRMHYFNLVILASSSNITTLFDRYSLIKQSLMIDGCYLLLSAIINLVYRSCFYQLYYNSMDTDWTYPIHLIRELML